MPPAEERLAWLTGFTGSAGAAVLLRTRRRLFVDGRYTLQAADRSTPRPKVESPGRTPPASRLDQTNAGDSIGYDPWLHTTAAMERLAAACAKAGAALVR